MILILKRIHPITLVPDIEGFFRPYLKGGLLQRSGRIVSIKVHLLRPPGSEKLEFNALVDVEPDAAGRRLLKRLNRKPLNGKYINIEEFRFRSRHNDRRVNRYQKLQDRRQGDRRRIGMEIRDITAYKKNHSNGQSRGGWSADVTL